MGTEAISGNVQLESGASAVDLHPHLCTSPQAAPKNNRTLDSARVSLVLFVKCSYLFETPGNPISTSPQLNSSHVYILSTSEVSGQQMRIGGNQHDYPRSRTTKPRPHL